MLTTGSGRVGARPDPRNAALAFSALAILAGLILPATIAAAELLPDSRMKSSAEYLKNGEWVPGHEVTYFEDPEAEVRFH